MHERKEFLEGKANLQAWGSQVGAGTNVQESLRLREQGIKVKATNSKLGSRDRLYASAQIPSHHLSVPTANKHFLDLVQGETRLAAQGQ